MRFDLITIFPEFFTSILAHGVLRRAIAGGLVGVEIHDLRGFAHDRHRTVDDRPFGGGEGMVLKPEPLAEAVESLGMAGKRSGIGAGAGDPAVGAGGTVYAGGGAGAGGAGAGGAAVRAV